MRIVLNPFGSFGDVHPYLALALELRKRGHDVVFATAEIYRAKVAAAGLAFAPVRPDVGELLIRPELVEKLWHPRTGAEFLIREYLLPALDQSFEDLAVACRGADLLLAHSVSYAGPIVAETMSIRWLSVALQPMMLFSADDPPLIGGIPGLTSLHRMSPAIGRMFAGLAQTVAAPWAKPIHRLRKRAGLPALALNPLFAGQFSLYGTIALFSPRFGPPQRDWPPQTVATGFPFYDEPGHTDGDPALERFLDDGPPPVLFTLGSSAVMQAGAFYEESAKAAVHSRFRAILLVGPQNAEPPAQMTARNIHIAGYLPYAKVMPRCAAIVHQGGIGTTSQALRAGKPMLVVPWAFRSTG